MKWHENHSHVNNAKLRLLQISCIFHVQLQQIAAFLQRLRKVYNFPQKLSAAAACVKHSIFESAFHAATGADLI